MAFDARCFKIDIPEPCLVGWSNMEGSDTVRFCGQCQKNVFNLSNMTEAEVEDIFRVQGSRICVSIRSRADGTTYVDNCPRRLRVVRNFLRAYLPIALVALAWVFHQGVVDAQGLVGWPMEGPGHGCLRSREVGVQGYIDYGYDTARDVSRVVTLLSFVATAILAFVKVRRARLRAFRLELAGTCLRQTQAMVSGRICWWAVVVCVVPVVVHLVGTFCINNFGGFGGGL